MLSRTMLEAVDVWHLTRARFRSVSAKTDVAAVLLDCRDRWDFSTI